MAAGDNKETDKPDTTAPAVADADLKSTMQKAVQYDESVDRSTFIPVASLVHSEQFEGESRADYLNRLGRGGAMDRIVR